MQCKGVKTHGERALFVLFVSKLSMASVPFCGGIFSEEGLGESSLPFDLILTVF